MSEENVETLRALFRKIGRGEQAEALYEVLDPDVELDLSGTTWLDAGIHRGHADVQSFFRRWVGTWSHFEFAPEQLIDVGDRVVVVLHQVAEGRGSGVKVENRIGQVWTFRGGKAVRWQMFEDPAEAFEAAGLPEQDPRRA